MCRCFVCDLDWDAIGREFDADTRFGDVLPPVSYRVQPHGPIGMVAADSTGSRHLGAAAWSLIPTWSQHGDLQYPTYNARIETASTKPTFADSMRGMRAILPANGYYEWNGEHPFYFHLPDQTHLAMAGLYSWWQPAGRAHATLTATILTTQAVAGAARVHHRMPVLLPRTMWDRWLDPGTPGAPLIDQVRSEGTALSSELEMFEVAPPDDPHADDGPGLIEPIDQGTQLSLFG